MANQALSFAGGVVPMPAPTSAQLRNSAVEWVWASAEHQAAAENQAIDGDADIAIEQMKKGIEQLQRSLSYLEQASKLEKAGQ